MNLIRIADEQTCEYLSSIDKEKETGFEIQDTVEKKSINKGISDNKSCHQSGQKSNNVYDFSKNLSMKQNNNFINKDLSNISLCNGNPNIEIPSSYRFFFFTANESDQQCKEEMKHKLLSLLSSNNYENFFNTLLPMLCSSENEPCTEKSSRISLLVQIIHCSETDLKIKNRAAEILFNVVHMESDDRCRRREIRVLKLLEQVREHSSELKSNFFQYAVSVKNEEEVHPVTALGALLKLSFNAEYRQAICNLGGLYAITELIQIDHETHGIIGNDVSCITLRRYAGMTLTNLTFGDNKTKNLLCSLNKFMFALVDQLKNPCEDLQQVSASVIRNLSWRADDESKFALRAVGTIRALILAAMTVDKEATLKSILSALWNLSAHCTENKEDICTVPGALKFLVKLLMFESSSKTLVIIENAGGILRNISSLIAVREDFRQILRDHNCFEILLKHLRSPSLTVVSNACGTLWNLSARCAEDQSKLLEMGAINMLRNLVQSKHKMISIGSSAALKNLLQASPGGTVLTHLDSTAKILGIQGLPTLNMRKQRALKQEININLGKTCNEMECNEIKSQCKYCTTDGEINKVLIVNDSNRIEPAKSSDAFRKSDSVSEISNQILKEECFQKEYIRNTPPKDFTCIPRLKASKVPSGVYKKDSRKKLSQKSKEVLTEQKLTEKFSASDLNTNSNVTIMKYKGEISSMELKSKIHSGMTKGLLEFNDLNDKSSNNVKKCDLMEENDLDNFRFVKSSIITDIRNTSRNRTLPSTNDQYGDNLQNSVIANETLTTVRNVKQLDNIKEKAANITIQTDLNKMASKNSFLNYDDMFNFKSANDNFEEFQKLDDMKSNFKIFCHTKNSKYFETETNKICQEIYKYQEMGCSFNSDISLISNSSFLDASDCQILDFDYDNTQIDQTCIDFKNEIFSVNKDSEFSSVDRDFENLESLNIDSIEDIELENSFVSVASIKSEIADISFKNQILQNNFSVCSSNTQINSELTKDISSPTKESLNLFDEDNFCQKNLPQEGVKPLNTSFTNLTTKHLTSEDKEIPNHECRAYSLENLNLSLLDKKLPKQLNECLKINGDEATALLNSDSINDIIKIGPAERQELVDNAKLVALFLKNAAQNSDSDINTLSNSTEFSSMCNEIDTITYIKVNSQIKSLPNAFKKEKPLTRKKENYSSESRTKRSTAIPILDKNFERKFLPIKAISQSQNNKIFCKMQNFFLKN